MKREHPGYRARNQDVEMMYRMNESLCKIHYRMQKRKDYPVWLLKQLNDLIFKSNCLMRPLREHRDKLPPFLEEKDIELEQWQGFEEGLGLNYRTLF